MRIADRSAMKKTFLKFFLAAIVWGLCCNLAFCQQPPCNKDVINAVKSGGKTWKQAFREVGGILEDIDDTGLLARRWATVAGAIVDQRVADDTAVTDQALFKWMGMVQNFAGNSDELEAAINAVDAMRRQFGGQIPQGIFNAADSPGSSAWIDNVYASNTLGQLYEPVAYRNLVDAGAIDGTKDVVFGRIVSNSLGDQIEGDFVVGGTDWYDVKLANGNFDPAGPPKVAQAIKDGVIQRFSYAVEGGQDDVPATWEAILEQVNTNLSANDFAQITIVDSETWDGVP